MSEIKIDNQKRHKIILASYAEFRKKEKENLSRSKTISNIVEIIKKELK